MNIVKYNNFNILNFKISDNKLLYLDEEFNIQSPVISEYSIINHNENKYIEVKFNYSKSHRILLELIKSLEDYLDTGKTQMITDILNNTSIKFKINNDTLIFNKNHDEIKLPTNNTIIILFKINYKTMSILNNKI